jgi:hypothetical protein
MLRLPPAFQSTTSVFSDLFTRPTFKRAHQLLIGAILCPGARTVCNALRALGRQEESHFTNYHRVLNRAKWQVFKGSRLLLRRLLKTFLPTAHTVAFAVDETIERRRGSHITKKGVYRDPVRSSASHFVKCTGLRWMSLMLISPLAWPERHKRWVLPFLTARCPSERFYTHHKRQPKKLTDWARQMLYYLSRYVRPLYARVVLVGDGSYATYELMKTAERPGISLIGRLKFNARLFHLPKKKAAGRPGRQSGIGKRILSMTKRVDDKRIRWRDLTVQGWYGRQGAKRLRVTSGVSIWDRNKGVRCKVRWLLVKDPDGDMAPALYASNDTQLADDEMIQHIVHRWGAEVTFHDGGRHPGMETQRQWSDLAIERTTPVLLALKSIVCLLGERLYDKQAQIKINRTAWYGKEHLTFSDGLAAVRRKLGPTVELPTRGENTEVGSLTAGLRHLYETLALAVA